MAANDLLAIGCYDALEARGRDYPEDISIVGFNDMPLIDHLRPPLTTVRVPQREIGKVAAELLLERLREGIETARETLLEATLIVRGSTTQRRKHDGRRGERRTVLARSPVSLIPDARVQAAIENWGPRLIANGIDYNDFIRITTAISRWAEWLDAWRATAVADGSPRCKLAMPDTCTAPARHSCGPPSGTTSPSSCGSSTPSATVEPPRPPSARCSRGPGVARPGGGADRSSVAQAEGRHGCGNLRRPEGEQPSRW